MIESLGNRERITREEFLELEIPTEEELSEVMNEFHADKNRIREIEEGVKELESEINELVYDLYGLDEEEIETVEEFLKRT
ncbi:hypothetical protein AKJ57_03535 [candidate division MSBL1 archaeon SCGC-AAA259A05]|uniref:Uncharacterized protein n=1 Tax=candidate division MSBL1 archaeon SCGC-AAA259A05 TaxID=1698259 RepID=A0A133U9E7_9EURY|nr:hypothetical protein AKJ57_03535 [candidate division MSBL1 archaeon SCGC-AAA259A05]